MLCLELARVAVPMNKVKGLKNSFSIRERGYDYHQMEELMAGTNDIESSPAPPFGYLF